MNKKKSAILELRVDRRTRNTFNKTFMGIPVVTEQKYLGVIIDDCLNYRIQRTHLK